MQLCLKQLTTVQVLIHFHQSLSPQCNAGTVSWANYFAKCNGFLGFMNNLEVTVKKSYVGCFNGEQDVCLHCFKTVKGLPTKIWTMDWCNIFRPQKFMWYCSWLWNCHLKFTVTSTVMVAFTTVVGSSIPCLASWSFLGEMDERRETGYKAKKSLPVSSTDCLLNKNISRTSKKQIVFFIVTSFENVMAFCVSWIIY